MNRITREYHEPTVPKPDELRLTTTLPSSAQLKLAAEWMSQTGCIVGLGDGEGLVYVTHDAAVAGWIAAVED